MPSFYEFFAGGGMARAGLGPDWTCLFANDIDSKKGATYDLNWSGGVLKTADIRQIEAADLPGYADVAWASPPCQDLSLAGAGTGLKGAPLRRLLAILGFDEWPGRHRSRAEDHRRRKRVRRHHLPQRL